MKSIQLRFADKKKSFQIFGSDFSNRICNIHCVCVCVIDGLNYEINNIYIYIIISIYRLTNEPFVRLTINEFCSLMGFIRLRLVISK